MPLPRIPSGVGKSRVYAIASDSNFTDGYRNREDTSFLSPKTLVGGSHDVLTDVSGRIGTRKGYIMDGAADNSRTSIRGWFSWETQVGVNQLLRAGFLTTALNDGKLQLRYVNSSGVTTWYDLLTGLSSTSFNFVSFWDTTNVRSVLLMVNGSAGIWEWSGAIGTVASSTANTITISGTKTWAQNGFYAATGSVIAAGVTYAYTGGTSTTTLTGVSPSAAAIPVGTVIYQAPVFTASSTFVFTVTPTPPTGFTIDLISQLNNQVMMASLTFNLVYLSVVGTYKDYSQSAARLQYQGDQFTTQGTVTAFIPEDNQMYISAGIDEWYITDFIQTQLQNATTSVVLTYENAKLDRLKTSAGQATTSQALTTKAINTILYVSNEPIVNSLGFVANYFQNVQVEDISYSIVNDINTYDFTDGSIFYFRKFIYLTVPREGLYLVYNMTNPQNPYWEAPQHVTLSGFSNDGNTLIGHSYLTSESYVMNVGYSDRALDANHTGNPISTVAVFAFNEEGVRTKRKSFNEFWTEGYMNANTELTVSLIFRSPNAGVIPSQTLTLLGTDPYVLTGVYDNSFGKFSFGKTNLGGDPETLTSDQIPSYFAVSRTLTRNPYLAYQPAFSTYGVNMQWYLLSFGSNSSTTTEIQPDITI